VFHTKHATTGEETSVTSIAAKLRSHPEQPSGRAHDLLRRHVKSNVPRRKPRYPRYDLAHRSADSRSRDPRVRHLPRTPAKTFDTLTGSERRALTAVLDRGDVLLSDGTTRCAAIVKRVTRSN